MVSGNMPLLRTGMYPSPTISFRWGYEGDEAGSDETARLHGMSSRELTPQASVRLNHKELGGPGFAARLSQVISNCLVVDPFPPYLWPRKPFRALTPPVDFFTAEKPVDL